MANKYDYFNVEKAKINLKNRKEEIYNHYNIRYNTPEKIFIECTNLCNARCTFCFYKKTLNEVLIKFRI